MLDIAAELFDLFVFDACQCTLFKLYLLVLVLKVIEELSHLGQLVLVLKLNHLQFRILQPDVMFDQLSFPV